MTPTSAADVARPRMPLCVRATVGQSWERSWPSSTKRCSVCLPSPDRELPSRGSLHSSRTLGRGLPISAGCHGILARCCASQMQPFPFGTQRSESLLPQLARLSIQTVSWRASQKDPGAYVLPHGTVHQNHAWNIDQLHGWIDALSPNIDIISVLTYPQF